MSRNLWIAVAVVALIAIVIIVGLRSPEQTTSVANPSGSATASPRASATSSAAATTASAAVSGPTASTGAGTSGVYNDDYGFLVLDVGISGTIRKESSSARIGSVDGISFTISPDARGVAYWTAGTNQQLRVFPASDPSRQQTIVTLSTEHGVGVAWSGDGADSSIRSARVEGSATSTAPRCAPATCKGRRTPRSSHPRSRARSCSPSPGIARRMSSPPASRGMADS